MVRLPFMRREVKTEEAKPILHVEATGEGIKTNFEQNEALKTIHEVARRESILVAKDIIADLYTGFERVLSLAGGLLYNVSKRAGRLMARRLADSGVVKKGDVMEALRTLAYSLVDAGYAEVVDVLEAGDAYVFRLRGSLLGSRLKGRKKPVDQPIAGYIAGWLEELVGTRFEAREEKCEAKGDPYCEIIVVKP